MSNFTLTANAVQTLLGSPQSATFKPVLQLLNMQPFQTQGKPDRFKSVVSDGTLYMNAILGGNLHELCRAGKLTKYTVIRLTDYVNNNLKGKKVIIALNVEILGQLQRPIGEPKPMDPQQSSPTPPQAAQAPKAAPVAPPKAAAQAPAKTPTKPVAAPAKAAAPVANKPIQQAQGAKGGRKSNQAPLQINENSVQPISSLNPYQPNWVIKARIIAKSGVKEWSKPPDKKGKLFSIDLQDSEGSKIRCVFFNDLVDQYADTLQEDEIYYIARGHLKFANKQYSNIPNDFEISADNNTQIVKAEDDGSISRASFDYIRLSDVKSAADNCSVFGIIDKISAVGSIKTKAGKQVSKRTISLMDYHNDSVFAVDCTIWDKKAEAFNYNVGDVIMISNAKKTNFGGVSLSTNVTSTIQKVSNDDADALKSWYEGYKDNRSASVTALTQTAPRSSFQRKNVLSAIKDENLGHKQDPDWLTVNVTITFIKNDEHMLYPACPTQTAGQDAEKISYCGKKMTKNNDKWHCDTCGQDHDSCNYKYIMNLVINDFTGSRWVTAFDKAAQDVLGHSAADLAEIMNESTDQKDKIIQSAYFKDYTMKLKVKAEPAYSGEGERLRCNVFSVKPINYADESKRLLDEIKRYDAL